MTVPHHSEPAREAVARDHLSASEHDKRAAQWRQIEDLSPVPSSRRRARENAEEHERCATALRLANAAGKLTKRNRS